MNETDNYRELRQRVLVVDDDPDTSEFLAQLLESHGFLAYFARNGEEALSVLLNDKFLPALIILDLVMPVMDGWRFREIQKNHVRLWHIPVIILSTGPIAEDYLSSISPLVLLLKPIDPTSLADSINSLFPDERRKVVLSRKQSELAGKNRAERSPDVIS